MKKNIPLILMVLVISIVSCSCGLAERVAQQAESSGDLQGTYVATIGYDSFMPNPSYSVERTITFEGKIFTSQDAYLGKTICEYFIPGGLESGQIIRFTNIATGEEFQARFKYIAEYDCFTIGEGGSAITYYRK